MIDEPFSRGDPSGDHSDSGEIDGLKPVIEAVIFVSPDPIPAESISELLDVPVSRVESIIAALARDLESRGSGLQLRQLAGGYGYYTIPEASDAIESLIKNQANPRLTRAALETLAIVAYLQPVSRGTVAAIRGIQSESVIRTLVERGLVEESGKGGPPGYPALYRTTDRFLERFGLGKIEDLPPLENFIPDPETLKKIEDSLSWEVLKEQSGIDDEQ